MRTGQKWRKYGLYLLRTFLIALLVLVLPINPVVLVALILHPDIIVLLIGLYMLFGAALVASFAARGQIKKRCLALMALGLFVVTFSKSLYAYPRFFLERAEMEASIAHILVEGQTACPLICYTDGQPVMQIAFIWDGFIGNWHGVCYDPTGLVAHATWPDNIQTEEQRRAIALFRGDLITSEHIDGPWYFCSAT